MQARRWVWVWIATTFTCTLPAATAGATPWLRVRAKARVELHATQRGDRIQLQGQLLDDMGSGLARREVELRLEPATGAGHDATRVVHSDASGAFAATFSASAERYRAHADFAGDAYYERGEVGADVEAQRSEVQLELTAPTARSISLDQPMSEVVVKASSAAGARGLSIDLQDELGRVLASGVIDESDELRFVVGAEHLGEPGLGEFVARTVGDTLRAPADTRKPVLRTRNTQLALEARFDKETRRLRVEARLHSATGPLSQRAVGIFVDDEHVGTLLSDRAGRLFSSYDLRADLGSGMHRAQARFESDAPGLLASRSQPVTFEILAPERANVAWLLAAVLLSIAFAIGSARKRGELESPVAVQAENAPAIRLGAPVRGRPSSRTIDGNVRAAETGVPLTAAILIESTSGEVMRLQSDAQGRFSSPALPAGHYGVSAVAPGFARAAFELAIPHPGTGTAVQIALHNLRALALDVHALLGQRVLQPEGPNALSIATARDVLRRAAGGGGKIEPTLARLTDLLEHVVYAREAPTEHDLLELRELVTQELARFEAPLGAARDPDWEQ